MKLVIVLGALALTACTAQDNTQNVSASSTKKVVAESAYQKPGAAVTMDYEWVQKPGAGSPGQLKINFHTGNGKSASDMQVKLTADNNIQLKGNLQNGQLQMQKATGNLASEMIEVTPSVEGLHYINVFVETNENGEKRGRAFAIPVQIGNAGLEKHPNLVEHEGEPAVIELPAESR